MTFTMMEKDQDMAKITLEEEVRNGKKIQIGKIIKLKKKKKKGFDKFEWRFCVDNLNWKTTILHKDWQKELWKPKVIHAQTVQENEQGVSVKTNSIEKKIKQYQYGKP